ncbi:Histidinol dehydrogenase [Orchesella cincta]|uniref:Histidinol dehydrogenase n=1 Tax=Orchesella cincta TaxID=48709 RepID=A0A1D2MFF0_ORCCI|nr:Histidinol dehydrogenase [Orchesella cincta]
MSCRITFKWILPGSSMAHSSVSQSKRTLSQGDIHTGEEKVNGIKIGKTFSVSSFCYDKWNSVSSPISSGSGHKQVSVYIRVYFRQTIIGAVSERQQTVVIEDFGIECNAITVLYYSESDHDIIIITAWKRSLQS